MVLLAFIPALPGLSGNPSRYPYLEPTYDPDGSCSKHVKGLLLRKELDNETQSHIQLNHTKHGGPAEGRPTILTEPFHWFEP